MIFLHCIDAWSDNANKNVIWSTYDGVKWSPNAYDLDTTLGMAYDGNMFVNKATNTELTATSIGFWLGTDTLGPYDWYHANLRGNAFFEALLLFYADELEARYAELRNSVLSYENIEEKFTTFINSIPEEVYESEATRFPTRPSNKTNIFGQSNETNLQQILDYAREHLEFMDTQYLGEPLQYNQNYFNNN
jgi:hypothetical protein